MIVHHIPSITTMGRSLINVAFRASDIFWASAVVLHRNADVMLGLVNADHVCGSMAINLGQSPSFLFPFPLNFFGFHPFLKCI